jgi:putative ABC transport system permease protein
MLGIIIGVGAVIVIVSLGQGMSNDVTETFESMGTNLLTVTLRGRGSSRNITTDEIYEFVSENQDTIAAVTPMVDLSVTAKYEDTSLDTNASGVGEDFCLVKNYGVGSGRFINYIDIIRRQKVCVIGTYVAQELFGGEDPLGQSVKINGMMFTVVGVLEEKAGSEESSTDDHIYMPYSIATKLSWMARISSYSFSAADKDQVEAAKTAIEERLYKVYEDESAYRVSSQAESIEQLNELTGTIMTVLVAIAAISLLVGGIGIMNIMLVSVTERTREIGIRKSLGVRKRDIMRQFVIEAATTSSVGGIMGIILGVALAQVAGNALDMTAAPSVTAILVAFLVSLSIGLIFGLLPANKAAKLNPIDALRYE